MENGLDPLVVSDKDCDEARAGVCVSAGCLTDEDELPDLYLLGHMVLMGSDKFPDENYRSAFLRNRGGSSIR
jgi:secreted Zn-dependent insulinase-like peptidase